MSHAFINSVVLVQQSAGVSLLFVVSLCTDKLVRAYFRDVMFPEKGTMCKIEDQTFRNVTMKVALSLNDEDA